MKPANFDLIQQAQVIALANRQRVLNREQEQRTIDNAVRDLLKELK